MKIYIQFGFLTLMVTYCIAAKNSTACEGLLTCEKEWPVRVSEVYRECTKAINPYYSKPECDATHVLYPPGVPSKLFSCTAHRIEELNPEEKTSMIRFETCAKDLEVSYCKDPNI